MSELTIKGTVVLILPEESGVSKAGKEWKKKDFVIETEGQYPKTVAFTCFGDKTDLLMNITEGQKVDVSFNLESKKYNERWFHNVNAWKIIVVEGQEPPPQTSDIPPEPEGDDSDLPF